MERLAETNLDQLKDAKKLEVLLDQSKIALSGGGLVTAIVVLLFWNHLDHLILSSWLGFYLLISYTRYRLSAPEDTGEKRWSG